MKSILVFLSTLLILMGHAQQTEYVDFTRAEANLIIEPDSSKVSGYVAYAFDVKKSVDSIYIDAVGMDVSEVKLIEMMPQPAIKHVEPKYKNNGSKIIVYDNFNTGSNYEMRISYAVKPKKALYFLNRKEDVNIWTQGQGKYTSHWLPSFDDVNEKVEFDLNIELREEYIIIANGKLDSISDLSGSKSWHYNMEKPMSSYLVALAIGDYNKKEATSKSGIPLEYYYYPEDSLKVEPTYRYSKLMFDFLEEEIGVSYPWQNYKQVPVHDFLYAGMENTSITIFSDAFVVDSIAFNDKNYVNVNAHELAHQWFGNLVTAKSGEHHWLQEGFATYYALLAEQEVFGEDYFHFKLLESAIDLGRQDISGNGTSLLNPKSSSLTFYQRGAWVLYVLRETVGDNVFKQAVKEYLNTFAYSSVETKDFIETVERLANRNLSGFVNKWINQKTFPFYDATDLLKQQSTFVNEYLMVDCEAKNSKCSEYLKYYVSDEAKIKVISQMPELVSLDTFKSSLKVRQAIATHVSNIPQEMKDAYESLLDDKSYITAENALYNLWVNFPLERAKYLSKTRKIHGFSDKNVRLLWILLNLNTPYYNADSKQGLFTELVSYTVEGNNADLRMNAFRYLDMIKSCDSECIKNLENAKTHHNWRLVKYAKELSNKLQKDKQ